MLTGISNIFMKLSSSININLFDGQDCNEQLIRLIISHRYLLQSTQSLSPGPGVMVPGKTSISFNSQIFAIVLRNQWKTTTDNNSLIFNTQKKKNLQLLGFFYWTSSFSSWTKTTQTSGGFAGFCASFFFLSIPTSSLFLRHPVTNSCSSTRPSLFTSRYWKISVAFSLAAPYNKVYYLLPNHCAFHPRFCEYNSKYRV